MVAEGRWSTVNYRLTYPEASVVTRRLESDEGTPAAIAQSIRMLDSSVDIYFTRTNFTGYQAMLEKGFCADLSGEAELSRQVNDMADCIKDAVTVDGKICAVPYGVIFGSFSTLGCSQAAFDTLASPSANFRPARTNCWTVFCHGLRQVCLMTCGSTICTRTAAYCTV